MIYDGNQATVRYKNTRTQETDHRKEFREAGTSPGKRAN